jgi:hypothetical protein
MKSHGTYDEAIEQKVLRLIEAGFRDVNKTPTQIARFLNEKGYRTHRGTRWTARTVESTWEARATRKSECA